MTDYKYNIGECFQLNKTIYVIDGINENRDIYYVRKMTSNNIYVIPREIVETFEPLLAYVDKDL